MDSPTREGAMRYLSYRITGAGLLFWLLASMAQAQMPTWEVVATTPSPGATNVAAQTTVSFTFSLPLSLPQVDTLPFDVSVAPCTALRIAGASPCSQRPQSTLSEDGRTLLFAVEHLARTTYTWSVPEIVATETDLTFRLFFLTYATADVLAGATVQGTVQLAGYTGGLARVASPPLTLSPLGQRLRAWVRPQLVGLALPSLLDPLVQRVHDSVATKQSAASFEQMNPEGMVVVLVDAYGNVAGGATVALDGTFAIAHVPEGRYALEGLLLHYNRQSGTLRLGYAMLDADQDGEADSIQVSGENISGLILTGSGLELTRITAAAQQAAADQMAAIVLEGTATLSGIAAASVPLIEGMPDGKALLWVYLYGSSDADPQVLALVQGSSGTLLPLLLGSASQLGLPVPLPPLPTPFVDSDVAVAAAEASGGADFRLAVSNAVLVAMLAGLFAPLANQPEFVYEDPALPVWTIAYLQLDYWIDTLEVPIMAKTLEEVGQVYYVHLQQGTVLGSRSMMRERATSVTPLPSGSPEAWSLEPNYPNPFRTATVIPFRLAESSAVVLEVINPLGQRVTTLLEGTLPAGRYEVRWEAGHQAAGLYLVRLRAGAYQKTQLMVLQR
ncbi:T9SS type A sorting domain-containing protein [Rhodothermus bifroesti]|uniref:T9SS type A sorting domain-containing protein n=2 Tax=Rhodothermus bifroesti TaxID=2823335 RepID=UPI001AEF906E|nr:T9SS type A sorting domain-containing protein [Rhodothermus bifroesti]